MGSGGGAPLTRALRARPRHRALIVNCYLDETRRAIARPGKIPQPMGPAYLAAAFARERFELKLHNELSDGPLEDARVLGWPELVVLTGLVTSLDRMRHITAYARTLNPRVVVVGGGHVVRAFPRYCRTFLDYALAGDVEELGAVLRELYGPGHVDEAPVPRFELVHWTDARVGYPETSRYCNFRCAFCTLTAERRRYAPYPVATLRRHFDALGRRRSVVLLDNNFYGNDRRSYAERLALLAERRAAGDFKQWVALVTGDFFLEPERLAQARAAGCFGLFSGVESFDAGWNASQNKRQNAVRPQVEIIRECTEAGLVFLYGLMLDVTTRSVAELDAELASVLACPEVTLPGYLSVPIPLPGTPFFYQQLDGRRILPGTRVRDLDATTISLATVDPLPAVADFVRRLQSMQGYRLRIARHALGYLRRYRRHLSREQRLVAALQGALLCMPLAASRAPLGRGARPRRTHVSSTEVLDPCFRPAFRVAARYAAYFEPTPLVDARGEVAAVLAADVEAARPPRAPGAAAPAPGDAP